MDSIFTSPCLFHLVSPNFKTRHLVRTHKFTRKSFKNLHIKPKVNAAFTFKETPRCSKLVQDQNLMLSCEEKPEKEAKVSSGYLSCQYLVKSFAFTLLCFAIGLSNFGTNEFKGLAIAAVVEKVRVRGKGNEKEVTLKTTEHEFSDYTRRLLRVVALLLRRVEKVRNGNGDVKEVREILKSVKAKREDLQGEIMGRLYTELRYLRKEKVTLEKKADEIVDKAVELERENAEKVAAKGRKKQGKDLVVEKSEEGMEKMEEEYSGLWERIGEIEDEMLRRETSALSIGVRELRFIERECEELVQRLDREIRQKQLFQR